LPTPPLSDALAFEAVELVRLHGSQAEAARALGISRTTLQTRYNIGVQRTAALGIEAPHLVKGTSTLFDGEGKAKLQWVKTKIDDKQRWAMMVAAIEKRCENIVPRERIALDPYVTPDSELCNLITLTDCHVGALAWAREAGEDWDLTIAKETLTRVFVGMIRALPAAGTCVINQLGDFLHTDGLVPATPAHGHILDADSRFQKISEYAVDILEDVIVEALARHERVHIIMAEGNHDESSSVWLRVMFKRLFRDNPRVTVDDSPLPYYVFQHGKVMLAFHHGHKLKPAALPQWFAAKHPKMWGETVARYGHSGHQHHLHERDEMGMRWCQHPTIAASDAYSARGGWLSPREAIGITYDTQGEAYRLYARPQMFRDMER
jgi:hypothetical protein